MRIVKPGGLMDELFCRSDRHAASSADISHGSRQKSNSARRVTVACRYGSAWIAILPSRRSIAFSAAEGGWRDGVLKVRKLEKNIGENGMANPYEQDLDRNAANYQPL